MPLFHFVLRFNGEIIKEDTAAEFDNADAAVNAAIELYAQMMREPLLVNDKPADMVIEVFDAAGKLMKRICH